MFPSNSEYFTDDEVIRKRKEMTATWPVKIALTYRHAKSVSEYMSIEFNVVFLW